MTPEPPPIEQKVLRFFGREQAYWTANGSLIAFSVALTAFGLSPTLSPNGGRALDAVETSVAAVAFLALIGIFTHMARRSWWLSRWCYLILCFATALTTVSFVSAQVRNDDRLTAAGVVVVLALLTTGGLVALSMHVEHGGRGRIRRTKEDTP